MHEAISVVDMRPLANALTAFAYSPRSVRFRTRTTPSAPSVPFGNWFLATVALPANRRSSPMWS